MKSSSLQLINLNIHITNRALAQLLGAHAIGAGGLGRGLNPGSVKSAQCRQQLATAVTFLWSCVAQALSRGDRPATRYTLRHNTVSTMKI